MLQDLFCCEWHYVVFVICAFMVLVCVTVLTLVAIAMEFIKIMKENKNEKNR